MAISSSSPENVPGRCPGCGGAVPLQPSKPYGEAACPQCGKRLWFAKEGEKFCFHDAERVAPIRERVRDIVAANLGIERPAIRDAHSFVRDIGADTLDLVEFMLEIEKEFGLTITDEQAERMRTVGDLVDYLMRQER
jgi:acyl carrier protein